MVETIIQVIIALALGGIIYLDKITHQINPPLNEYWYAVLFVFSVFGRATVFELVQTMADIWRKK